MRRRRMRRETAERKQGQETENRRQETGDRRQEIGDKGQKSPRTPVRGSANINPFGARE
jgi:hypothetical protein